MDIVSVLYKNFITQMNVLRRQVGSLLTLESSSSEQVEKITLVLDCIDKSIEDANLGTSWLSQDLLHMTRLLLDCKPLMNLQETEVNQVWTGCFYVIVSTANQLTENMDDEKAMATKKLADSEI